MVSELTPVDDVEAASSMRWGMGEGRTSLSHMDPHKSTSSCSPHFRYLKTLGLALYNLQPIISTPMYPHIFTPPPLPHTNPHFRYLKTLGLALYNLQPISTPGFAFCWLEMVAHRTFMPRMLGAPGGQGGALYEVRGGIAAAAFDLRLSV